MDEFGVLVEKIGFKAHGNSAPMAKLKPKPNSHFTTNNTSSFVDSSLPVDELDRIFRSSVTVNKTKQSENLFNHDDIFGGSSNQFGGIDFESVLNNSNVNNWKNRSKLDSLGSSGFDDLLGLDSKQGDPINDDVFGSFKVNTSGKQEEQGSGFVDLIPGFEGYSHPNKERQLKKNFFPESNSQPSHPKQTVEDDPFLVFESSASPSDASSIFDNLDDFASGRIHEDSRSDRTMNKTNKPTADPFSNGFENVDYLDAMFMGSAPKSRPASTTQDSQFDFFFPQEKGPAVKPTSLSPPLSTNKVSFFGSTGNDLTSLFGDVGPSSGAFHEIEGESKERRMARLNRHMRMNTRVAEALAEKNQRDLQSQYEQEEKNRLSGTLDDDIKRWAAGKEGNLRALLSSLQQVLWPECGWRQVSLTDLITSDSVKKVYKRAALCVHPDKVQQKGANLQQKYIAEKVFDLLKEASNKFSAEELR